MLLGIAESAENSITGSITTVQACNRSAFQASPIPSLLPRFLADSTANGKQEKRGEYEDSGNGHQERAKRRRFFREQNRNYGYWQDKEPTHPPDNYDPYVSFSMPNSGKI